MNFSYLSRSQIIIPVILVSLLGFFHSAAGQEVSRQSDIDHTFQISFLPGISNTDSYSTSRFSLNILGGYNGAFHGFEMGSIFNSNRYDISGVQMAGIANVNESGANGVLLGGVVNYTESFGGGVQASGVVNIIRAEARGALLSGSINYTDSFTGGLMASGALNISSQETSGLLLAGGLNITGIQRSGLMIAGGLNISEEAAGVAISPMNIARNHSGVQFGVMNITGRQDGTQIGIINVVGEESEGMTIGLLSFVEGGRFNVDVWGSETGFINGGVRIGTEQIYNVISIGYNPFHGNNLWQTGLGIGYYQPLGERESGIETDLMFYHVNHDGKWTTDLSNHIQLRIHYTHSLSNGLSLFTGPSFNLYLADEELSSSHIPFTVYDHSSGSNQLLWWPGWSVGLQLF